MELSAVLTMLRRWSVSLAAAAIAAGAVAFAVASTVPPTYSAEAQVLVGPVNTDSNTLDASQELVQTYGSLVTSDRVTNAVIDALDLDLTPAELRDSLTSRAASVTRILSITAVADDAAGAADIANGVAIALQDAATDGQSRPEGQITVVSQAVPDPETAQPVVPLIVVLAAGAGLIAGLAMVLLIDYFGDTISSREDLQRVAGAPVLGSITPGRVWRRGQPRLVVERNPQSTAALAYRLMATHFVGGGADGSIRSVLVLGAEGQEGAGEVAANLAAALVHSGQRVRLVDVNDEDHEVTRLLEIRATHGLMALVRGGDASLVNTTGVRVPPGIDVFATPPGRDQRLNDHDRIRTILELLEGDVDIVIISSAAVHRSETALLWARAADAAIVVARRDRTKRDSVTITTETLRAVGTPVLGTVLHGAWRRPAPLDVGRDRAEADTTPTGGSAGDALAGRSGRS